MTDRVKAEFESTDKEGETLLYTGSVGTGGTSISNAGLAIDEVSIRCRVDQLITNRLLFSFDNSVFHRLKVGEMREEEPRGDTTVLYLKALAGTVDYEVAINYGRLPPHP
jgi:hypothetical protein